VKQVEAGKVKDVALVTIEQHTFSTETERRKNSGSSQSLASLLRAGLGAASSSKNGKLAPAR
jgi:hypothetical protein